MIPTKIQLLSLCGALLFSFSSAAMADDYGYYDDPNLEAPNVSFYGSLQGSSNNLHYLGAEREDGVNLLAGAWFKDVKLAGLSYGVEVGYQNFGSSERSSFRLIQPGDFDQMPPGLDTTKSRLEMAYKQRLSTLSFGGRLAGDYFFFRFGGALYSYRTSEQRIAHYVYPPSVCGTAGCPSTQQDPTYSKSASSLAPYVGFGVHVPFPFVDHLRLTAGYDVYNVESHRVESVNVGLMYTD